mmetsp:Transcript_8353/g.17242  ORF Transcript_8353/g.17242 Transcript_8353/m.17242 type:complete len:293 (+) Transcript_8353:801-1679(+)
MIARSSLATCVSSPTLRMRIWFSVTRMRAVVSPLRKTWMVSCSSSFTALMPSTSHAFQGSLSPDTISLHAANDARGFISGPTARACTEVWSPAHFTSFISSPRIHSTTNRWGASPFCSSESTASLDMVERPRSTARSPATISAMSLAPGYSARRRQQVPQLPPRFSRGISSASPPPAGPLAESQARRSVRTRSDGHLPTVYQCFPSSIAQPWADAMRSITFVSREPERSDLARMLGKVSALTFGSSNTCNALHTAACALCALSCSECISRSSDRASCSANTRVRNSAAALRS